MTHTNPIHCPFEGLYAKLSNLRLRGLRSGRDALISTNMESHNLIGLQIKIITLGRLVFLTGKAYEPIYLSTASTYLLLKYLPCIHLRLKLVGFYTNIPC